VYSGVSGFGVKTFSAGVEISVRWQEKSVVILDQNGEEVTARATVYHAGTIALGDYLYLGSLSALDSAQGVDPAQVATAYEVKAIMETPSTTDATRTVKAVMLV